MERTDPPPLLMNFPLILMEINNSENPQELSEKLMDILQEIPCSEGQKEYIKNILQNSSDPAKMLEEFLKENGYIVYNAGAIKPEEFWRLWEEKGRPPVLVEEMSIDQCAMIPEDATIWCGETIGKEFLDAIEHVKNAKCLTSADVNLEGYTGKIPIENMFLTNLACLNDSQIVANYWVGGEKILNIELGMDCKGRSVNICEDPIPGTFSDISKYFKNIGEIYIMHDYFKKFAEEAPELVADPSVKISVLGDKHFDFSILDKVRIGYLRLGSKEGLVVENFEGVTLDVGEIEYDKEYEEAIRFASRYKRTKSSAKK